MRVLLNGLFGIFFLVVIIGIDIGAMIWIFLKQRKAEKICRELVEKHFHELRMMVYAEHVKPLFLNKSGILVMFKDRISFWPMNRSRPLEIQFGQISRVSAGRFVSGLARKQKLELETGTQRLRFHIPSLVGSAWRAAVEHSIPSASPGPIG
jgi:hypothetical protein